tara:strand:- start:1099 stop:2169 length:1071 start_codon:yes stop_codon:yes gene_type:complete
MVLEDLKSVEWDNVVGAIEACYELGWTDGLPVVPPTVERVQQFIDYLQRPANEILGSIPERRREITVGKVAANSVMAGCLPEYAPVVVAATEAMLSKEFNLIAPSSSQGGAAVLIIVNGPISREIGMNSKANIFGPGNRANATIGRAIRLILMNSCGSIPGLFDRTLIGHPGKYTYCIAENELETHWNPLHAERGFQAEQNAVTVFPAWEPRQVRSAPIIESVLDSVVDVASVLGTSLANDDSVGDHTVPVRQGQIVITIGGQSNFWKGWSKDDVRHYLHPRIRRSLADLKKVHAIAGQLEKGDEQKFANLVPTPDDILIVYAGSPEASGYRCSVIHSELPKVASSAVTHAITLPH